MKLFRELVKIIKQVFGLENMFGYRTTLANQLYLMYTMLGQIYFEDKLHWQIKFVYFLPNFAQLCVVFSLCVLYSIYGFRNDFILFTQMAFLILLIIYLTLIVPLASWIFGENIEKMIGLVDCMLVERKLSRSDPSPRRREEGVINMKSALIVNFFVFCVPLLIYVSAGTCDVIVFYEEEKVKNYIYYTTPFPHIHEYGSLRFFLFVNIGIAFFVGSIAFVQLWSIIAMPFLWAAVCHNEVMSICNDLRVAGVPRNIGLAAKSYQRIGSIIRNFREFYNVLCTVTLVQLLVVAIANAYVVLLWDIPYLIKIRGTAAVWVCITMVFQLCSIGEMIDNLANIISCEIYSTPWYYISTQHRRDVQLFLCQAQTTFDLSAFKVYPFGLSTVLRFVNLIYSTANFLRKVTQKMK